MVPLLSSWPIWLLMVLIVLVLLYLLFRRRPDQGSPAAYSPGSTGAGSSGTGTSSAGAAGAGSESKQRAGFVGPVGGHGADGSAGGDAGSEAGGASAGDAAASTGSAGGPTGSETIKGNPHSMLYHTPASPYYERTITEELFETESEAEAAGYTRWNDPDRPGRADALQRRALADVPEGDHGPGSAHPKADGTAPHPDFTVKGNKDSMLFHTSDSPYWEVTVVEQWFIDEETAEAAGFTRWDDPDRENRD